MAASDDDVLQKADAFMRRHRVFVAGATSPPAEATADEADDVPVLTEVVAADALAEAASAPATVDPVQLHQALAAELDTWLDEQLPAHVMRVLDGITDQMIGQLSEKARDELLPRLRALLEAAPAQGSDEV